MTAAERAELVLVGMHGNGIAMAIRLGPGHDLIEQAILDAVLEEREACAKVADGRNGA